MTQRPHTEGGDASITDSLVDLWQTGGTIPVEPLLARLRQHNSKLRRINQLSFVVCVVALIMTGVLEFVGQLPTGGLLTLIGTLSVLGSWWKYRRDKAKLIAAYSEEPKKLLPFLIKRTIAARNLGRYYYLTPLPSLACGYLFARLTGGEAGASTAVLALLLVITLFIIFGLVAFGLRLAHRKTKELKELRKMLAELEA